MERGEVGIGESRLVYRSSYGHAFTYRLLFLTTLCILCAQDLAGFFQLILVSPPISVCTHILQVFYYCHS